MDNNITQSTGEDNVKRLKIILLSFAISFSLFFTKIFAQDGSSWKIYLVGGIYFVVTFLGLLWAFEFKAKLKSLLYVLQGSLFVFSEVIFVLFFFIKEFTRLYESVLLIILLLFMWVVTYACCLMVNVFNVSLFKNLPLLQVAQTALYIITLLMLYFFTFSIMVSGFPLYVIFPILFAFYIFIFYTQFKELGMEQGIIWRRVILVSLINMFALVPFIFVGYSHELIAIIPTIGGFVGGGLLNLSTDKNVKWQVAGYNILFFVAISLIVYLSWF